MLVVLSLEITRVALGVVGEVVGREWVQASRLGDHALEEPFVPKRA